MTGPRPMMWMSFVDTETSEGGKFLGVCVVPAASAIEAIAVSHAMGCNPGGEVLMVPPFGSDLLPEGEWVGRLLTRAEAEHLDTLIAAANERRKGALQ